MREILFRGKTPDGHWTYGYYEDEKASSVDFPAIVPLRDSYHNLSYRVVPETVGQYTGLKDKFGTMIFEGDAIKYQRDSDDCPFPDKDTKPRFGRIFFSEWRASFSVTAGRNLSSALNNDLYKYIRNENRVEVIGNIWDNSELLKEE